MQEIGDVLLKRAPQQRQKQGASNWGGRVASRINDKGRKTNTNCVDGDTDWEAEKAGTRPKSPEYVFSVGKEVNQTDGTLTLQAGAIILPNVLIDSLTTCNPLGQETWEWLKKQNVQYQTRKEA